MGAQMYYDSQKSVKDDKREALREKLKEKLDVRKQREMYVQFGQDVVQEDQSRVITNKMMINKGFTRKRKKEDYNPRVKRRKKFERATYKRIVRNSFCLIKIDPRTCEDQGAAECL